MDPIPGFEEIFRQIKTNLWFIGLTFDNPRIKLTYFIIMFNVIIVLLEETGFFISKFSVENFLELTQLAPCIAIGYLSLLKIIFFAINRRKIYILTLDFKKLYGLALNHNAKRELIRKDFLFLRYLLKYFFILNAILICVYNFSTPILIAYHYYTKNVILYILPYAVLLPFSTKTWQTWLLVYLHLIIIGFVCVIYYTTVDALYYTMTTHICCQFSLLSDEIKKLNPKTAHLLKNIVNRHQLLLKLSEDLEEIFQGVNLFNVLTGSLEICALGFNLTMGQLTQIPGVALFLLSVLIQILMISVFGENLIRESRKIGEAAFLCKWYEMDTKSKKNILILMLRSSKPQKLTGYKFTVISYQSFTKIISTSWSYFTILKTIYTPPDKSNV